MRGPAGVLGQDGGLDLAGMLVDGLSAASGLLGLPGDGPVTPGEDGGGVADEGAKR